jgi:hypothetical protein
MSVFGLLDTMPKNKAVCVPRIKSALTGFTILIHYFMRPGKQM